MNILNRFFEMYYLHQLSEFTELERDEYLKIQDYFPDFIADLKNSIIYFNCKIAMKMVLDNTEIINQTEFDLLFLDYITYLMKKESVTSRNSENEKRILDLLMRMSPIQLENYNFSFYKSIYKTHFILLHMTKELEKLSLHITNQILFEQISLEVSLNQIYLSRNHNLLNNFASELQFHSNRKLIEKVLVTIINLSKTIKTVDIASSNSISILNLMGFSFSGINFSLIRAPHAILKKACLYQSNLSGSYLHSVNLCQTILDDCDLQNSILSSVDLGMYPLLCGHTDEVNNVNFNLSTKLLISSSQDKTVRVWQIKDSSVILKLQLDHQVVCAQFSYDSKYICTGDRGRNVILWDAFGGQQIYFFKEHEDQITCVAFSYDNTCFASSGKEGMILIYSFQGKIIKKFQDHLTSVNSINFSKNSENIVTSSDDQTIRIYNLRINSRSFILKGHARGTIQADFSPNSDYLASIGRDSTLKFWNVIEQSLVNKVEDIFSGCILSINFSPDGRLVACAGEEKFINIVSVPDGQQMYRINTIFQIIKNLRFSSDFKFLTCCGDKNKIMVLYTDHYINQSKNDIHNLQITDLKLSFNKSYLISCSQDKTIKVWSVQNNQVIKTLVGHTGSIKSISISPDDRILASGAWDRTVRIWRISDGKMVHIINLEENDEDEINQICFSKNQEYLAICVGAIIRVYNAYNFTACYTLKGHVGTIFSINFSNNNSYILSASADCTIKIWSVLDGVEKDCFIGHSNWVYTAKFSNDNLFVVSGCFSGKIRLWSMVNGVKIKTIQAHQQEIYCLNYSFNDKFLISSSKDMTIKLWNATNFSLIQIIEEKKDITYQIFWIHDSTSYLYAFNEKKQIKIYFLQIKKPKEEKIQKIKKQQLRQNQIETLVNVESQVSQDTKEYKPHTNQILKRQPNTKSIQKLVSNFSVNKLQIIFNDEKMISKNQNRRDFVIKQIKPLTSYKGKRIDKQPSPELRKSQSQHQQVRHKIIQKSGKLSPNNIDFRYKNEFSNINPVYKESKISQVTQKSVNRKIIINQNADNQLKKDQDDQKVQYQCNIILEKVLGDCQISMINSNISNIQGLSQLNTLLLQQIRKERK